jgi:glycosyltransferase involved in cell wall biosynthesis
MEVLYNKNSDIRWKYAPWLYYRLEDLFIPRFDSINVVHEKAVDIYQKRYPHAASKVRFLPTWMDPEVFYPLNADERQSLRHRLCSRLNISGNDGVLVSVGRLDRQKDPLLLIDSFAVLAKLKTGVHLVVVGDGVLRGVVKKRIQKHRLEQRVTLAGLLPNDAVANWLRAADMMVLSSAYEGMPRCVVEAMGCGLPVATTDVGEVRTLVKPGINGEITEVRSPDGFAGAICRCLGNLEKYSGAPCLDAASQYVPSKVLKPVYETYRQLTA